jgi:SAM-dependent methyltransferase
VNGGGPYTERFYERNRTGSRRSAELIVPLIIDLVRPRSVIDVGCGVGTWLSVFLGLGVEDVWGVDGNEVAPELLEMPVKRFLRADLRRPLSLPRRFDLAMSLEVAEHLPEECAAMFVESLVTLAPIVVFSAAIPFQGGTNHVNEQWQDYWAALFERRGYVSLDPIRPRVWSDDRIEWWYAQNLLVFVERGRLESDPRLVRAFQATSRDQLRLVHPRKYLDLVDRATLIHAVRGDIASLVRDGGTLVLVDGDDLRTEVTGAAQHVLPFLEHDGHYWGPPPDDATAIAELERLRARGATCIAFARPAFWWLAYYSGFERHLRHRYQCVLENDRLVAFDLRRSTADGVQDGEHTRSHGPAVPR